MKNVIIFLNKSRIKLDHAKLGESLPNAAIPVALLDRENGSFTTIYDNGECFKNTGFINREVIEDYINSCIYKESLQAS